MPDESEVIQSDVFVELPLPNGKSIRGNPVPYPIARKIMAQIYAFDKTQDFENTLVPALEQFTAISGITDEAILAACPGMQLGEICVAVQRFFFRPRQTLASGGAVSKTNAPAVPGA